MAISLPLLGIILGSIGIIFIVGGGVSYTLIGSQIQNQVNANARLDDPTNDGFVNFVSTDPAHTNIYKDFYLFNVTNADAVALASQNGTPVPKPNLVQLKNPFTYHEYKTNDYLSDSKVGYSQNKTVLTYRNRTWYVLDTLTNTGGDPNSVMVTNINPVFQVLMSAMPSMGHSEQTMYGGFMFLAGSAFFQNPNFNTIALPAVASEQILKTFNYTLSVLKTADAVFTQWSTCGAPPMALASDTKLTGFEICYQGTTKVPLVIDNSTVRRLFEAMDSTPDFIIQFSKNKVSMQKSFMLNDVQYSRISNWLATFSAAALTYNSPPKASVGTLGIYYWLSPFFSSDKLQISLASQTNWPLNYRFALGDIAAAKQIPLSDCPLSFGSGFFTGTVFLDIQNSVNANPKNNVLSWVPICAVAANKTDCLECQLIKKAVSLFGRCKPDPFLDVELLAMWMQNGVTALQALNTGSNGGLYITRSAYEWLWGIYDDPLQMFLVGVSPFLSADLKAAIQNLKVVPFNVIDNALTPDYEASLYAIDTGVADVSKARNIVMWKNYKYLPVATYADSGVSGYFSFPEPVIGTDASQFHPGVTRTEKLKVWEDNTFRNATITYDRDVDFKGLHLYQFILDPSLLAPNPKYYQYFTGMANITAPSFGLPVFLSKPHFLDADPSLPSRVIGMTPDRLLHDTFVGVEPISGATMCAHKRLQINIQVMKTDLSYQHFNGTIFHPIMYIEERAHISDQDAELFTSQLYGANSIRLGLLIGFTIIGCLLIASSVGTFIVHRRRLVKKVDEEQLLQNENKSYWRENGDSTRV